LIASNSGTPELIAFGTTITPYFSTLAVPTTTLALTDRLALRYYVARSGRTITMHTENSHLCQIITTFTTGLTALNGLTAQVQNFATGTSGSDFNISSSSSTHTFNLPNASDTARGVVTTGTQTFAGYKIFNGTIGVNNDLQLATVGTALNTFIKNINSTGLTSIGSNGFGFNNANNIYFSGSSKGGGVFAFSNTGTQTYTLQDASGTLAFTSDITTALGDYVTIGTTQTITGAKTFETTTSSFAIMNSTNANGGVLSFRRNGTNVGHIGNSAQLGAGVLDALEVRSGSGSSVILKTDSGQLTLASGGAATFSSSVGVGLSGTPAKTLEVRGTLAISNSSSSYWYMDRDDSDGRFKILTDTDNERFSIATGGAATFSSSVTTGSTLQANGNVYVLPTISGGGSGGLFLGVYPETPYSKQAILVERYTSTSGNYGRGNLHFCNRDTADANQPTLADSRMTITSSGNVGIGTASPTAKLQVRGANEFSTFFDAQNEGASGATFSRIGNSYPFNRFLFQNGYIDVLGSYMTYPVSIEAQSGGGQLALTRSGAVAEFYMGGTTGGSTVLYVRSGGSGGVYLAAGSTGWVANSDERLKTDLVPIENGLEKVASLRSVIGRYLTDDEDKKRAFLIAQDVEKVLPEAVVTIEETGDMGVNYTEVIPLLVAAIKELKTEIDSLKNQIK